MGRAVVGVAALLGATSAVAQEASPPRWIWAPGGPAGGSSPAETRHFRKEFAVKEVSKLVVDAAADNQFTLMLDGKPILSGTDWGQAGRAEVTLSNGSHVLAASATNTEPGPAGFLVRGGALPLGQGVQVQSNATWKVAPAPPAGDAWTKPGFDDAGWVAAVDLGALGVAPWGKITFAGDIKGRFKVPDGFEIAQVADPTVTGSGVSFSFDPQGRPCVGVERGPIVRLIDADKDGTFEDKVVITPGITNCQGFSFVRGKLLAVGEGPSGTGIYRLEDGDGDGVFEQNKLIRGSTGAIQEHGAHAVMLGTDGRLYFNNGNHTHLRSGIAPNSPYNIAYEGEILPHYNDSRGHAVGIAAPCGEILRSDDAGETWSRIAAGFRNHYDFALNRDGEAFTFDSDMEWDIGLPWYRPVRVLHATPGAEFGSRNGSAVWPTSFYDSMGTTLDLGRGSPTGVTFNQGNALGADYDDNFLICDWSQGRIIAVALTPDGATYSAKARELVVGQPLNCTDIEVGPDGAVYFTNGGRGTQGGLFKVSRPGAAPKALQADGSLAEALALLSPQMSYTRARLAAIQQAQGDQWATGLVAKARDPRALAPDRVRSLDLLAEFGPAPGLDLATELAADPEAKVRARAMNLIGMQRTAPARAALVRALADPSPVVRRRAAEGLIEQPADSIPVDRLLPLFSDPDRRVRYAARIAVEHANPAAHRAALLASTAPRPLLEGFLALARAGGHEPADLDDLLRREVALFETIRTARPDPAAFLDILRVIGLTIDLSPKDMKSYDTARLRELLLDSFPSGDRDRDRELARLLACLDEPQAITKILDAQAANPDRADQIHLAYCVRNIKQGWTPASKARLWAWHEAASHWDGGHSYLGYLDFMVQDLIARFTPEDRATYLANGATAPFPTRVLVRNLNLDARPDLIATLVKLDTDLGRVESGATGGELRALIAEALGRSSRPRARAALSAFVAATPGRRDSIAKALAARPTPDDLPMFVAALESADPSTVTAVARALAQLPNGPTSPEGPRNLIRLARRAKGPTRVAVAALGARWFPDAPPARGDYAGALKAWEEAYAKAYPEGPALGDEVVAVRPAYTLDSAVREVITAGLIKSASPDRGRQAITKARCLQCHKFGAEGQGVGPDLTTISSRFRPTDVLESIVHPSKVISDQYKSLTVATVDGKVFSGMPVASDDNNLVLLLSDGSKETIPKAAIDEQKPATVSVMPEGLLDLLSPPEIADMLALFESAPRVEVPATAPK